MHVLCMLLCCLYCIVLAQVKAEPEVEGHKYWIQALAASSKYT
jgi:hypothetical protein